MKRAGLLLSAAIVLLTTMGVGCGDNVAPDVPSDITEQDSTLAFASQLEAVPLLASGGAAVASVFPGLRDVELLVVDDDQVGFSIETVPSPHTAARCTPYMLRSVPSPERPEIVVADSCGWWLATREVEGWHSRLALDTLPNGATFLGPHLRSGNAPRVAAASGAVIYLLDSEPELWVLAEVVDPGVGLFRRDLVEQPLLGSAADGSGSVLLFQGNGTVAVVDTGSEPPSVERFPMVRSASGLRGLQAVPGCAGVFAGVPVNGATLGADDEQGLSLLSISKVGLRELDRYATVVPDAFEVGLDRTGAPQAIVLSADGSVGVASIVGCSRFEAHGTSALPDGLRAQISAGVRRGRVWDIESIDVGGVEQYLLYDSLTAWVLEVTNGEATVAAHRLHESRTDVVAGNDFP